MELPGYVLIDLPLDGPLDEADSAELKLYENWFLANIDVRLEMLRARVAASPGVDAGLLDHSEQSMLALDSWLRSNLRLRPRTEAELSEIQSNLRFSVPVDRWTLDELSCSFCFDTAIYFGETLRRACYGRWVQERSARRSADFGHVLVKGRGKVPLNPLSVVLNLAVAAARESTPRHNLHGLYRIWYSDLTGISQSNTESDTP